MAQSGDPRSHDPKSEDPSSQGEDHDDLIGFASPRSLHGQSRETPAASAPGPAPSPQTPEDEPDLFEPAPVAVAPVIQPRWGATAAAAPEPGSVPEPTPEPEIAREPARAEAAFAPPPEPRPDPRTDFATPEPPRWSPRDVVAPMAAQVARPEVPHAPRAAARSEAIEGQTGLFAVYALILLIVPTLGVSGAIALFAVMGRAAPTSSSALSHHVFQKRTLFIGVGVAVAGVLLMAAPFALGVIALFGLALWLIVRGAWGLWRLKSGLPISNPRGLWI